MQRIARNVGRALRIDRDLYSSLLFDSAATADAVLIVAVIGVVPGVVGLLRGWVSALGATQLVLSQVIGYLIGWLVAAGILHLLSTRIFGGFGRFQAGVALAGYAYVPIVFVAVLGPILANPFDGVLSLFELLLRLAGMVWFAAGLARVADVAYDVAPDRRYLVAGLAVLGWWVITTILL
ncbi:MAG: YIP1 family protein [Acidimicrobiia bacterium]